MPAVSVFGRPGSSNNNPAVPVSSFFTDLGQSLDYTMRSLSNTNELMLRNVLDQNKALNDTVRKMTDHVQELTLINKEVSVTNRELVEEFKLIRKQFCDMRIQNQNPEENSSLSADTATYHGPLIHGPLIQRQMVHQLQYPNILPNFIHGPLSFNNQPTTYQQQLAAANLSLSVGQFFDPSLQHNTAQYSCNNYYEEDGSSTTDKNAGNANTTGAANNFMNAATSFATSQNSTTSHADLTFSTKSPSTTFVPLPSPSVKTLPPAPKMTSSTTPPAPPKMTSSTTAHAPPKITSSTTILAPPKMPASPARPPTTASTNSSGVTPRPSIKPVSSSGSNLQSNAGVTAPPKVTSSAPTPTLTPASQKSAVIATTATPIVDGFGPPKSLTTTPAATTTTSSTAPSMFTSFSFGKQSTNLSSTNGGSGWFSGAAAATTTPATNLPLGGNSLFGSSMPSFSQLSQQVQQKAEDVPSAPAFKGFAGAGQPIFGSKTPAPVANTDEQLADEPFEPTAEFKPLIDLPPLIEAKTGEEDEIVLFKDRAKLFRFDKDTGEFKERGLGDMKLLQNSNGGVRVLMRREQTLKLCANHCLTPDMKLLPLAKSNRAYTWLCQDFSDKELKPETLAVRFKTPAQAEEFRRVFEKALGAASNDQTSKNLASQASCGDSSDAKVKADGSKNATGIVGFGDQFRPAAGSWDCPGCTVNNGPSCVTCPCCGSTKDGAPVSNGAASTPSSTFGAKSLFKSESPVKFGFGVNGGFGTATVKSGATPSANGPATGTAPATSGGFSFSVTPGQTIFGSTSPASIFGGSSTKNSADDRKTPTVDSNVIKVDSTTECPGCVGCSLSDAETDRVFEKLEEMACKGPRLSLLFKGKFD